MPATQNKYATTSQMIRATTAPRTDPCVTDQKSAYQSGTTATCPAIAASVNISRAGRGVKHRAMKPARKKTRCYITCTRAVANQTNETMTTPAPNQAATGQEKKLSAVMVMRCDAAARCGALTGSG